MSKKLLPALLQVFGGRLASADVQQHLFLWMMRMSPASGGLYAFVPGPCGAFSFQAQADLAKLGAAGVVLERSAVWEIADRRADHLSALAPALRHELLNCRERYAALKGDALLREAYRCHPYYASTSEAAARLVNGRELLEIQAAHPARQPQNADRAFFSIGYEGRSIDAFLERLVRNHVRLLGDVRRNPHSRKYGFSRTTLRSALETLGIGYEHLPELGIASEKRRALSSDADRRALFDEYERLTLGRNETALEKLQALADDCGRIAIVCFEADPEMCHRSRILRALRHRRGWSCQIDHL